MQDFEAKLLHGLDIASNINNTQGQNGFKVPEGYFDTFENEIVAKINSKNSNKKIIKFFSKKRLYYAAAVAAVFITLISTVLFKTPQTNSINTLEYAALEDYLNEEELDLNYNELSNLIYEDGFIIESLNASNFSDDAIIEYLNENVEDSGLIIE
tara:strand:+ start:265 stop:729 length:465 start_codon:yes stop_codon:yes gene_type:complete